MRFVGLLLGALAMSHAWAVEPAVVSDDVRIDRLTDEVVKMIPLGPQLDALAAADPRWPLQSMAPEDIRPQWLSCARDALSARGYRDFKRAEMAEYANAYPELVDANLAVLSNGAAEVFSQLASRGLDAGMKNQDVSDPQAIVRQVLENASPRQRDAFVAFASGDEHMLLRRLVGIDATYGKLQGGQILGRSIVQELMESTMKRCQIAQPLHRPAQG